MWNLDFTFICFILSVSYSVLFLHTLCIYIYIYIYIYVYIYTIAEIKCIYFKLYCGDIECLNLIGWRTFWGVQLFSGRHTANVVPGSFRDRITILYHFAKWFLLFQRSYNRKITKTHNDIGQTNKYSKQKDKIDRSSPCFCLKIKFYYMRKAHILLSLSRSQSLPHRHTYSLQHTP